MQFRIFPDTTYIILITGVADPDVFGHPGSGFISSRYGSGYKTETGPGSFYHQAKIVRKALIPTAL
jgi:hypothetical protein